MIPHFRIWDKKKKKMIEPSKDDLLKVFSNGSWELHLNARNNNRGETVIFSKDGDFMWGTGYKDKNKKEIFEGDIVMIKMYEPKFEEYYGEVYLQNGFWQIIGRRVNDFLVNFAGKCEVVGNIFENPELLNKEAQDKDIPER